MEVFKINHCFLPFNDLPHQNEEVKHHYAGIPPSSNVNLFTGSYATSSSCGSSTVEFSLPGDASSFLDLSQSYFTFNVIPKTIQQNFTCSTVPNIGNIDIRAYSPVSQFSDSFISNIIIRSGAKNIQDDLSTNYGTGAFIRNAIMKPHNYRSSSHRSRSMVSLAPIGMMVQADVDTKNALGDPDVSLFGLYNATHTVGGTQSSLEVDGLLQGYPLPERQNRQGYYEILQAQSIDNGDLYMNSNQHHQFAKWGLEYNYNPGGGDHSRTGYYPKSMEFVIKPKHGIFESRELFPSGAQFNISITLSSIAQQMINTAFASVNVQSTPASDLYFTISPTFWVKRVYLSELSRAIFEEKILSSGYRMNFLRSRQTAINIAAGQMSFKQSNLLQGAYPSLVVLTFITSNAQSGSYYDSLVQNGVLGNIPTSLSAGAGNYTFGQIPLVTQLSIDVNGTRYPETPYTQTNPQDFQRIYNAYREASFEFHQGNAPYISFEQFTNSHNMFVIKTAKSEAEHMTELIEDVTGSYASLAVECSFQTAPTVPIVAVLHVISGAGIQFNAARAVKSINF